ncbi:MAG: hypothetical protein CBC83_03950 [Flavobacteriales bacterium TMED123]|nr:MAG: hypothetical protein CBC83_03950 [Flavobacteriales bacterium TMED123]|tara:strand:- start:1125 stop:1985 length:861 start_codon:yes stop_codon:yes gene_type:complete
METGANNIAPKVNYSPSKIDNLLTEKCHLSVEVGANHIVYTLFDTLNLTYVLLRDFHFEAKNIEEVTNKVNEIIDHESLLQRSFYSSSLTFANFPSTLVPTTFYKEEEKRKILAFNHEVYDEVLTDQLQYMEAVNIYSIPSYLLDTIRNAFPNTQIKCSSTILIEQLLFQDEKKEKVFASVKKDMLEICVIEDNKLAFHNCFKCEAKEDLLYYLLFTMEQLGLSEEETDLVLLDDILTSDDTYQLLYEYVKNISFGNRPNNLKYAKQLEGLKTHKYFCLFSQLLCA